MQRYSNTGYWLLGRIIERASGMSYEQYVEKFVEAFDAAVATVAKHVS